MDELEMQATMEKMSLLPDRYYIILTPSGEGEFRLTAYDTTDNEYETDEDFNAAFIVQEGVLAMIREKTDEIFTEGVHAIQGQLLDEDKTPIESISENVVKVDFGKKQ
ncbi:hypothetical protein [Hyphomonas sp.]|uniref:hypothetical protein n=1 Tax=Hyphomonas sp. TaxID=87 RepID=UPI000C947CF3|nr:hypothetical protein [Hyphomonas sp.]MAL44370.1 hypothetical protein [Hyphomonas sp.]|tara:strand:+ start:1844 stop:2167 length:324 start_codon:yes stop_codon:yes gene_type:complete